MFKGTGGGRQAATSVGKKSSVAGKVTSKKVPRGRGSVGNAALGPVLQTDLFAHSFVRHFTRLFGEIGKYECVFADISRIMEYIKHSMPLTHDAIFSLLNSGMCEKLPTEFSSVSIIRFFSGNGFDINSVLNEFVDAPQSRATFEAHVVHSVNFDRICLLANALYHSLIYDDFFRCEREAEDFSRCDLFYSILVNNYFSDLDQQIRATAQRDMRGMEHMLNVTQQRERGNVAANFYGLGQMVLPPLPPAPSF